MKIYRTLVPTDNDERIICDSFLYEGSLWLVPKWIENHTEGWRKPAYMIRAIEPVVRTGERFWDHDYVVAAPIPKVVLDGQFVSGYETHKDPDIQVALQSDSH